MLTHTVRSHPHKPATTFITHNRRPHADGDRVPEAGVHGRATAQHAQRPVLHPRSQGAYAVAGGGPSMPDGACCFLQAPSAESVRGHGYGSVCVHRGGVRVSSLAACSCRGGTALRPTQCPAL